MTNKLRRLLSSDDGAAGQLYRSCINLTAIEALGTRPFDDDDDARLVTRMNNTASALVQVPVPGSEGRFKVCILS